MSFIRRLVCVLVLASVAFVLGCSSDSGSSSSSSSGGSGTGATGPVFKGTLTGKGESGTVDVTLPAGTKTASVSPLADEAAPTNQVIATINLGNGKTVSLTGTYDAATSTLTISGAGYSLTGKLSGSTLTGTYTGPNGAGSFALQSTVSGAVNVYCGTYTSSDGGGVWNLVQGADNSLSGSYTGTKDGKSGLLTGTIAGNNISLVVVGSDSKPTGTLSGDTVNGTHQGGTWTGSKGGCAK